MILGRLQAGRITFAFTWISHSLFIHRPSSLWSTDSESAVNNSNYCIIAVASIVLRALWSPQSLRSLTRPIIKVMNVKRRNYLFLSDTCPSYTVSQTLEVFARVGWWLQKNHKNIRPDGPSKKMHTFWRVCVPQLVSIEMSKGRHPRKTPLFSGTNIFLPAQHIQIFGLRLIYGN